MELKQYFMIARRWAWLLILGLVAGAAVGYGFSSMETPVYQTTTKIMVSSSPNGLASTAYAIYGDQQLAQTYVQLLSTRPVLDRVAESLGYEVSSAQITAQQVQQGSQIIKITVEHADPEKAAAIANTLVEVLIERNETLQNGQYAASDESLQVQITQVEEQIAKYQTDLDNISTRSVSEQLEMVTAQMEPLQAEVAQLQKDIALLTPAVNQERKVKVAEMQARLDQIMPLLNLYQQIYTNLVVLGNPGDNVTYDSPMVVRLQSTLELYQQIYLNLINSRESIRLARLQNTPNVVQIESAIVPTKPVRPQPMQTTMLAGAVGLMLAAAVVFLVEYLDDSIKTMEDVERLLKVPVIGYIAQIQYSAKNPEGLYVVRQPRSPVSEAFRLLRTNLEFAGVDRPIRRLLITSTGPGEGKTTVAVNLAAMLAQGGKKVVLIDGDLRRPKVHRFLGLSNQFGLSDLFRGNVTLPMVSQNTAGLEHVSVVTTGSLPPNPTEVLASVRMDHILDEAGRDADIVIVDSPPSMVADVQVLAAKVDGVLVIVYPGHTPADAALATMEQLRRADARILGVVLNRIPRHRADYYGGYRHYSPYYSGYRSYTGDSATENGKPAIQRLLAMRPFRPNRQKEIAQPKTWVETQE